MADEISIKEFKEAFLGIIERHFNGLLEDFEKAKKSYAPLIKLLQVCNCMIENFKGEELLVHKVETIKRVSTLIKRKSSFFSDWRATRKLYEEAGVYEFESRPQEVVEKFIWKLESIKRAAIWKDPSEPLRLAGDIINGILRMSKANPSLLQEGLKTGRLEKNKVKSFLNVDCSIVLGDEGGIYLLLNTINPGSSLEQIILKSVSKEFLDEKRNAENKVILGEGSFGKVRFALSVAGNKQVDIGQLVCVKKSLFIGKTKRAVLAEITASTFEDFFAKKINESIHVPQPIDMAITSSTCIEKEHRKGYLFMEVFPETTADKVFENESYQKWEYQKPYILEVMSAMVNLLKKGKIFNSDLKPQNTLFDPNLRKMAIIDLGSSLFIDNTSEFEKFDISAGGFGITQPYCPPEISKASQTGNYDVNLLKAISYLCGITIAEITSPVHELEKRDRKDISKWNIGKKTDLNGEDLEKFRSIIRQLIDQDVQKRIYVETAMVSIRAIGQDVVGKLLMQENYINKLRKVIQTNPAAIHLNKDIMEVRSKGIIEQKLVKLNPRKVSGQPTTGLKKDLEEYLIREESEASKLFILLGEAGSGKSLAVQLRFLEEVENWKPGEALPIYFNMADEIDLDRVVSHMNMIVGSNLKLETENENIHLIIDSYDESSEAEKQARISPEERISQRERNILQTYFDKLSTWKVKKILLSCRTDFILASALEEDDFSFFKIKNVELHVRYIAPISYGIENSHEAFEELVEGWLKKENKSNKKVEILAELKKNNLEARMRTGLVFNMIMKLLSKDTSDINIEEKGDIKIVLSSSLYRMTIKGEIEENWARTVQGQNEKSMKKREKYIKTLLRNILQIENKNELDQIMIVEGLEKFGEMLAVEMSVLNKNRLSFQELERINEALCRDGQEDEAIRAEWKTLYQLCTILGLKLEKRIVSASKEAIFEDRNQLNDEIMIGFRHETYKNYFLLRGLKRITASLGEKQMEKNDDDRLLGALLENEGALRNYELLGFFGEEVNYGDPSLRKGLRTLLEMQKTLGEKKPFEDGLSKRNRASVIISILVAGGYIFWNDDLSNLNIKGAYLRGGTFYGTKFENTDLAGVNLSYADISKASFINANLTDVDFGAYPEMKEHTGDIKEVSWSPNGTMLASGSADSTIKIWNYSVITKPTITLKEHLKSVNSVCWSPDGQFIASGSSDGTVKIWSVESEKCLNTINNICGQIFSVSWSASGKYLAVSGEQSTIHILEVESANLIRTLAKHYGPVPTSKWSPSSDKIASGGHDKIVRVWNGSSGDLLHSLAGHSDKITCLSWSPDGTRIASGADQRVFVWDSENGSRVQTLEPLVRTGRLTVASLSWKPDGKKIAIGTLDRIFRVWDVESGYCEKAQEAHTGTDILTISWSSDSKKIATGSNDRLVKIWESRGGQNVQSLEGHQDWATCISWSPDGKYIVSSSDDRMLRVWDGESKKCLQIIRGHTNSAVSVSVSPNGEMIASGGIPYTVIIWDFKTGKRLFNFSSSSDIVWEVRWSPDSKKVLGLGQHKTFAVYSVDNKTRPLVIQGLDGSPHLTGSWSPDGEIIAAGNDTGLVGLWNNSGNCLDSFEAHTKRIWRLCWSPEGKKLATGSVDQTVKVWDVQTKSCLLTLSQVNEVHSLAWSPDGTRIVSGSGTDGTEGAIIIWDSTSGNRIQTLETHKYAVQSISWRPNGKEFVSSGWDKMIKAWEINQTAKSEKWVLTKRIQSFENQFSCVGTLFKGCHSSGRNDENFIKRIIMDGGGFWIGSDSIFQPNQTYFIRSKSNGLYWDIQGSSTLTGARLISYKLHRGKNQQFFVKQVGPHSISFSPCNTEGCVIGTEKSSPEIITQLLSQGNNLQLWEAQESQDGSLTIMNIATGFFMDAGNTDGTLALRDGTGLESQSFFFEKV